MERRVEGWVTTREAVELTGYSSAYIRYLAGRGKVEVVKAGRDWLVGRESVLAYKQRMDALGPQKHDPWREDLPDGRGRQRDDR